MSLGTSDALVPRMRRAFSAVVMLVADGMVLANRITGSIHISQPQRLVFVVRKGTRFRFDTRRSRSVRQSATSHEGIPRGNAAGDARRFANSAGALNQRKPDNPLTTNNEANDQPLGHLGNRTVQVYYPSSGARYAADADVEDDMLLRLYFRKGGWVDFEDCELEDLEGECEDETGRSWVFEGEE